MNIATAHNFCSCTIVYYAHKGGVCPGGGRMSGYPLPMPAISLLYFGCINNTSRASITISRVLLFRIYGIHLFQRRVKLDRTLRLHIMASMSQTNGADYGVFAAAFNTVELVHGNIGASKTRRHTSHARVLEAVLESRPSDALSQVQQTHKTSIAAKRLCLRPLRNNQFDRHSCRIHCTVHCLTDNAIVWYFCTFYAPTSIGGGFIKRHVVSVRLSDRLSRAST